MTIISQELKSKLKDSTLIIGILYFMVALRFALTKKDKYAKQVMFGSFIYLPVVQLLFVLDKI